MIDLLIPRRRDACAALSGEIGLAAAVGRAIHGMVAIHPLDDAKQAGLIDDRNDRRVPTAPRRLRRASAKEEPMVGEIMIPREILRQMIYGKPDACRQQLTRKMESTSNRLTIFTHFPRLRGKPLCRFRG